ncbi:S41 family peptidase [Caulobacter sp. NIBR1757]|uniref:S41 family peptidase n=1 Tax=Caulobacter sp. NIBR1757 TaxID=3016000 RepID=UPI0022F1220A|nr:S41 family peptidase [Caulobacter sp. NIBR1757]WGM39233.1 hypothetical protein AMEJIAPC_02149 [Caulobacter sp. NIBR1757]
MRKLLTAIAATLVVAGSTAAQTPPPNMNFDQGVAGAAPAGWRAATNGYESALDASDPHAGPLSVRLQRKADATAEQAFGTVSRTLDAAPYRGQRVRFRAAARVKPVNGQRAGLWLRIDRPDGQTGFFDNMADRPITSEIWQVYEIVGVVAPDAERIVFGALEGGPGTLWMDSASIEILGPAVNANEPARALTAQGQSNLQAFARLYGYVRWFHPSDESAKADWDALAVAGVQRVETARNGRELAKALREVFLPVAPTLIIEPGAPTPPGLLPNTSPLAWTHKGVQFSKENVYSSVRGAPPSGMAPDAAVSLDLGQGVTARMRLVLPAGAPGAAAPVIKPDKPEGFQYSGDDRATRLADVVIAWNVFQHFYPYFDVVKTDWSAELPKALTAAATDRDAAAFQDTLKRLVAALKDGHGNATRPHRMGLLPVFWTWAEDRLVVTEVVGGTDVRVGDVVLAIDGKPVADRIAEEEALISSATPQWRRWRALREMTLAEQGTTSVLKIQHADGTTADVTLTHQLYEKEAAAQHTEVRPAPIAELKPGLLYVDLERTSVDDMKAAQDRLANARAVIFDMRGYPGQSAYWLMSHLSDKTLNSANWNVPVVTLPDRQGWTWDTRKWTLEPETPRVTAKRVFMTDGRAISYAESIMGIVEAYRLGEIVGSTTAGTNGNINPFVLPGGYRLVWTGMKVTKHDGSTHHGVGIQPTIPVERTVAGIRAGRDEYLEAAIKAAGF